MSTYFDSRALAPTKQPCHRCGTKQHVAAYHGRYPYQPTCGACVAILVMLEKFRITNLNMQKGANLA